MVFYQQMLTDTAIRALKTAFKPLKKADGAGLFLLSSQLAKSTGAWPIGFRESKSCFQAEPIPPSAWRQLAIGEMRPNRA